MARLIVLSNRVQLPTAETTRAGGLAVALQTVLEATGGVWLGWNGEVVEDGTPIEFSTVHAGKVDYITTAFTREQYQRYYCGFANSGLWPAMHGRADLIATDDEDFMVYQAVNQLFAEQLAKIAAPEDNIWVQDYHFLSVAAACRKLGMQQRIGFFLHIPFAPKSAWQALASAVADIDLLLRQWTAFDIIGLQTPLDQHHAMQVLADFLPVQLFDKAMLTLDHSTVHINAYPIGIDVSAVQRAAQASQALTHRAPISAACQTIIAVERMDYSKGILRRLGAYAEFLRRYPEFIGRVQLYQIACPSRQDITAYRDLCRQIRARVTTIQADFGTHHWQPLIYQESLLKHAELMPLLRRCQVGWVNSIKDGMNLVAKEYLAAQTVEDAGVLLLSKYAGAAQQLTAAVMIDPYSLDSMVAGLHTALTMPKNERQARHRQMLAGLKQQDIYQWQADFLRDLCQVNAI